MRDFKENNFYKAFDDSDEKRTRVYKYIINETKQTNKNTTLSLKREERTLESGVIINTCTVVVKSDIGR